MSLVSAFRLAQEDQCYKPPALDEHRLMEGKIIGKKANENVVTTMVSENPGFLDEQ